MRFLFLCLAYLPLMGLAPYPLAAAFASDATSPHRGPLKVTIRPRIKKKAAPDTPEQVGQKVEQFISTHDWTTTLDNRFFSGFEDEAFIESYTAEASTNRFHGLNLKLGYYGDKAYGLEKAEIKNNRLYSQVSRNIIVPMFQLQTGDNSNNAAFTHYSRVGQNWLLMNMQTISDYTEKGTRRPIALMLSKAPKHFWNNRSLKKSTKIMSEKSAKKSTLLP